MESRDETIRQLSEKGFVAFSRDWALGESIGVAKRQVDCDGVMVYEPACVYLYPSLQGRWNVMLHPFPDRQCRSLKEAAAVAVELLELADLGLRSRD